MALFPVHDEFPGCRRFTRGVGDRGQLRDVSMLDEMMVKICGQRMWMWRAVDDEGKVLHVLVQERRNKASALKLLRKLLRNQGVRSEKIVTDGLAWYRAGMTTPGCVDRHRPGRLRDNNRVENSHLPIRRQERKMQRFKSHGHASASFPPLVRTTTASTSSVI